MTTGLTDFQMEVARLFFELPASEGFLLAGGGALLATGLTSRPTDDLDFFGRRGDNDVPNVAAQLVAALAERGWQPQTIQSTDSFVRIRIKGPEDLAVDIAIDVPPIRPPTVTIVGPTFDREELAGRKLLALFDRAAPRDFADVYVLAQHFGRAELLARAADVDLGFNWGVLADMIRGIARFADHELSFGLDVDELRGYFANWANELDAG